MPNEFEQYTPVHGQTVDPFFEKYTICGNCERPKYEHLSDGTCLFSPTKFKTIAFVSERQATAFSSFDPNWRLVF